MVKSTLGQSTPSKEKARADENLISYSKPYIGDKIPDQKILVCNKNPNIINEVHKTYGKQKSSKKQINSELLIESKALLKSVHKRLSRYKATFAPNMCKDINEIIKKLNNIEL